MPVVVILEAQKGWKTKNPEVRGDVIVMKFQNVLTSEILFTYAPKWGDIPIWLQMIELLCNYEIKKQKRKVNKALENANINF